MICRLNVCQIIMILLIMQIPRGKLEVAGGTVKTCHKRHFALLYGRPNFVP